MEVRRIKTQHVEVAYQFSVSDSPAFPISLVDPTGMWAPRAHDLLIDRLHSNVDPALITQIKEGSRDVDAISNQWQSGKAPEHSMTEENINAGQARDMRNEFLKTEAALVNKYWDAYMNGGTKQDLDKAAFHFGRFIHPIQDSTSPAHQAEGDLQKDGMKNWHYGDAKNHGPLPNSIERPEHITVKLQSLTLQRTNDAIQQYHIPSYFKAK